MATTPYIDHIEDVSASEQGGQIVSLTRRCLIDGLESASVAALQEALDALGLENQSLLDPDVNYTLDPDLAANPDLVLVQRDPKAINGKQAWVDLKYVHFSMNEFQDLANPVTGFLVYTTEAGLQEAPTQVDSEGNPIILGYTYGADEPSPYTSKGRLQGGEVTNKIPTKIKRLVGVLDFPEPDLVVDGILGLVNDDEWFGQDARMWLCSSAKWSPWSRRDGSNINRYEFTFELNKRGWDPKAVFVHEITGKIPGDWATNAGSGGHASFQVVENLLETNFDTYFSAFGIATDGAEDEL
jgi:hypothetical protein